MVQSLTSHTAYAIVGSMVQSLTSYTAYLKGSRGLIEFSIVLTVNMDMTDFDPIEQVVDNLNNDQGWSKHLYPLKFARSDVIKIHLGRNCAKELKSGLSNVYSNLKVSTALNKLLHAEKLLATLPIYR